MIRAVAGWKQPVQVAPISISEEGNPRSLECSAARWVGGAGVALARGCGMEEGPVFVPCVVWVECGELLVPSTE